MKQEEIEEKLKQYLNLEKIIWVTDGIDPAETDGHIDDVACYIRPGEVACIWTEDPENPFYEYAQKAYKELSEAVDAKGRKLKVYKLCLPKKNVLIHGASTIDSVEGSMLPKVQAAILFAKSGKKTIIASLANAGAAIQGKSGTTVTM